MRYEKSFHCLIIVCSAFLQTVLFVYSISVLDLTKEMNVERIILLIGGLFSFFWLIYSIHHVFASAKGFSK